MYKAGAKDKTNILVSVLFLPLHIFYHPDLLFICSRIKKMTSQARGIEILMTETFVKIKPTDHLILA
jgi:hypothetical protein